MKPKKSWTEKLNDSKDLPRIFTISSDQSKRWGTGTCVIPAPREVDEIMRTVPPGKLITINEIRQRLAAKHGATIACPITTGIFSWIAAHAAAESGAADPQSNPYWRTLKKGGEINGKYPGGIDALTKLLTAEGHVVIDKGKRRFVKDYQKALPPS